MTATGDGKSTTAPVLVVREASRGYKLSQRRLRLRSSPDRFWAVKNVSFDLGEGETLGIVGESGSGKSTLARMIMGLEPVDHGAVEYRTESGAWHKPGSVAARRDLQFVFQDPFSSLDPRMRVGRIIGEPLRALRVAVDRPARVAELLNAVGLSERDAQKYPHQFSGGQRQRIAIARALAPGPQVLIADEPVSGLDLSVQAQVLNVFVELRERLGLAIIFISHDLAVVNHISDRVGVMYQGQLVEMGDTTEVYQSPTHPHTRDLLTSIVNL